MAASRREQILQAILAALNTSRPGAVGEFDRSRTDEVPVSQLPRGAFAPIREPAEKQGGRGSAATTRRMMVAFDYWATPTDAECDPGLQWITKALVDQKLGGLVHEIVEEGTVWVFAGGSPRACRATVTLKVQFQTHSADQTLAT